MSELRWQPDWLPEKMVLIATKPDGNFIAFKVHVPVTDEELRRISDIQHFPGLAEAVWTGKAGSSLR